MERIIRHINGINNDWLRSFLKLLAIIIYPITLIRSKRGWIIIILSLIILFYGYQKYKHVSRYNAVIENITDYSDIFGTDDKRTRTDAVAVHHDANDLTKQDSVPLLRIHEFHKYGDGYGGGGFAKNSGFAYTFYYEKGRWYQTHRIDDATAHAYDVNHSMIGICMHGNFNINVPTDKMYEDCAIMVLFLQRKFNLDVDKVLGHRDIGGRNKTDCPGRNFSIEKLKGIVRKYDFWV